MTSSRIGLLFSTAVMAVMPPALLATGCMSLRTGRAAVEPEQNASLPQELGPLVADNSAYTPGGAPATAPGSAPACTCDAQPQRRFIWQIPSDVRYTDNGIEPLDVGAAVNLYDPYNTQFAWQTFIALNWTAKRDGQPDPAVNLGSGPGGDNSAVWEHWMNTDDVFRTNGKPPLPWGAPTPPPLKCKNVPPGNYLVFSKDDESQTSHDIHAEVQDKALEETRAPPVIDQKGRWVHYEIYINHDEYQYIVDNELFTTGGQAKFKASGKPLLFPTGSMEVKVAWKILETGEGGDDPKVFHTRDAVFENGDGSCSQVKVGLVAFHINYKTPRIPNHFWATFEHIANVCETDPFTGAVQSGLFCNKCCLPNAPKGCTPPAGGCVPINTPPPVASTEPPTHPTESSGVAPSELTRVTPITVQNGQLNSLMQDLVGELGAHDGHMPISVWQRYQLINSQWQMPLMSNVSTSLYRGAMAVKPPASKAPQYNPRFSALRPPDKARSSDSEEAWCNLNTPCCDQGRNCPTLVIPPIVANTIIEPYGQATSSCYGCHQTAKTTAGQDADFSFALDRAQTHRFMMLLQH